MYYDKERNWCVRVQTGDHQGLIKQGSDVTKLCLVVLARIKEAR